MKIKFVCDNHANIHSAREEIFDVKKHLNISPAKWRKMSDEEKQEMVNEWAYDYLSIYWEELDDGEDK